MPRIFRDLSRAFVCLDGEVDDVPTFDGWVERNRRQPDEVTRSGDQLCMLAGTGGTTGMPKGVRLTGTNMATATATTLLSYPLGERPRYLALAPLTHSAGVLTFPILALGGEIVIMPFAPKSARRARSPALSCAIS